MSWGKNKWFDNNTTGIRILMMCQNIACPFNTKLNYEFFKMGFTDIDNNLQNIAKYMKLFKNSDKESVGDEFNACIYSGNINAKFFEKTNFCKNKNMNVIPDIRLSSEESSEFQDGIFEFPIKAQILDLYGNIIVNEKKLALKYKYNNENELLEEPSGYFLKPNKFKDLYRIKYLSQYYTFDKNEINKSNSIKSLKINKLSDLIKFVEKNVLNKNKKMIVTIIVSSCIKDIDKNYYSCMRGVNDYNKKYIYNNNNIPCKTTLFDYDNKIANKEYIYDVCNVKTENIIDEIKINFDYKQIFEQIEDPLDELKKTSTNIISNNIFKDPEIRYNFGVCIVELFEKYKNKMKEYFKLVNAGKSKNISSHINNFTLIFKGGNIINSIINIEANNFSLFEKKKISDFDFSINPKYSDSNSEIENTKLLFIAEQIAKNILTEIRDNYNIETGMIKYNDKEVKITKDFNYLTIDKKETFQAYNSVINNTRKFYESKKQEKINNDSNIKNFYHILNYYNIDYSFIGYNINDGFKYFTDDELSNINTISFNKFFKMLNNDILVDIDNDYKKDIFDTAKKNSSYIYSSNDKNLILSENSLESVHKTGKLFGYEILDIAKPLTIYDTNNNFSNIDFEKKEEITSIKIITFEGKKNNLYITSNTTTKFIKVINSINKITSFSLLRIKYNIKLYFKINYSKNSNIKYFYINIPSEFIDISIPTFVDTLNKRTNKDYSNNIVETDLILKKNINIESRKHMIQILIVILYEDTENKPWLEEKYEKRIERLVRLMTKYLIENDKEKIFKMIEYIKKTLKIIEMNLDDDIYIFQNNIKLIHDVVSDSLVYFYDNKMNGAYNLFRIIFIPILINTKNIANTIKQYDKLMNIFNIVNINFYSTIKITTSDLPHLKEYLSKSIKMIDLVITPLVLYFDKINEENSIKKETIILGGDSKKYLKYKKKYLNLKNKFNI
jgi:hypothetical protein